MRTIITFVILISLAVYVSAAADSVRFTFNQ